MTNYVVTGSDGIYFDVLVTEGARRRKVVSGLRHLSGDFFRLLVESLTNKCQFVMSPT